jgi:L-asparagine transporter-like permease
MERMKTILATLGFLVVCIALIALVRSAASTTPRIPHTVSHGEMISGGGSHIVTLEQVRSPSNDCPTRNISADASTRNQK